MAYIKVDEIESALENLAAAYSATTELISVPNLTHEGRQGHVLGLGAANSERDSVLILGGMHAREWVPPDALISLAADLLEAFYRGTGLVYGGKSFAASDIRQVGSHKHSRLPLRQSGRASFQPNSGCAVAKKPTSEWRRMRRCGHQPQF